MKWGLDESREIWQIRKRIALRSEEIEIDKNMKERFKKFREQLIWLSSCYDIYQYLYESDDDVQHVIREYSKFFYPVNIILIEYLILKIGAITDAEKTGGKENLTVNSIDNVLKKNGIMTEEICKYSHTLMKYRKLILDSRNKIIAHHDKKVFLGEESIGGHTKEEMYSFFDTIQKYSDAVGIAVGVGQLHFQGISGPGDAIDLIRALECKLPVEVK